MDVILGALKSKTMWAAVLTIIAGTLVPAVNQWIGAHPGTASTVLGLLMGVLRTMTDQSLAVKGASSPSAGA